MSWCDKLASTPTVGFKLEPYLASGTALLDAMSPILGKLIEGPKQKFTVETLELYSTTVNTEEGFRYGLETSKYSVTFNHRMKLLPVSGGPPALEMLSKPSPYTKLLPEVADRAISATLLMPNVAHRKIDRVGIVSVTQVAEEDLPPGFSEFINYVGRPWQSTSEMYNIQISSTIDKKDEWKDTCQHIITKTEDKSQLITIQLDFGREYVLGPLASPESLKRTSRATMDAALSYFEELADGSRFDEDLIRDAATI